MKLPTIRIKSRRKTALLLWGLIYCIAGSRFFAPEAITPAGKAAMGVAGHILPIHWWGVVWITTGALCLFSAVYKKLEATAFGLAAAVMFTWGASYVATAINIHSMPVFYGAVTYLALASSILLKTTWPDPPEE